MAEIIARFADGRLLIRENRLLEERYMGSGIPLRIGGLRKIEALLSIDNDYSRLGLITRLEEARVEQSVSLSGKPGALFGVGGIISGSTISGSKAQLPDYIRVIMRRGDPMMPVAGITSGTWADPVPLSGGEPLISSYLNRLVSGVERLGEILSGNIYTSGQVRIIANVIGY
jgi:hypothetical protein